jgi:hypothetical protein
MSGISVKPLPPLTDADKKRFWSFVDRGGECWEWTGAAMHDGRGRISLRGVPRAAPRVSWLLATGENAAGYVCHACDNPACVNPAHLWVGTALDNMRDKSAKGRHYNTRKTHCHRGHEFTDENTYRVRGGRMCKQCTKESRARLRATKGAV